MTELETLILMRLELCGLTDGFDMQFAGYSTQQVARARVVLQVRGLVKCNSLMQWELGRGSFR